MCKITRVIEMIMSNLVRKLPSAEITDVHLTPKAKRREPGNEVGYDYISFMIIINVNF